LSASLSSLQPELLPFARELVRAAGAAGLSPAVTSARRSHEDQVRLRNRYLAGASPYFAAEPGTSAHEYGWAFDLIVRPMSALPEVGRYWEEMGGAWGGRATYGNYDPVHFEYPGWRSFVNWNAPDRRAQRDYRGHPGAITAAEVALSFVPGFGWVSLLADVLGVTGPAREVDLDPRTGLPR